MNEIDPKELAESLMDDEGRIGGVLKFCIRNKQCVRAMTCEHANSNKRGRSVEPADLFQGRAENLGDCSNWKPRLELGSELDVPRRKAGSGSRHNLHAPDRTRAREALGYHDVPDLTKGLGQLSDAFSPKAGGRLVVPPKLQAALDQLQETNKVVPSAETKKVLKRELPKAPDLNVSKHIRNGSNIIKDGGE